ncbi:N-acetylmuramoyl-L-alanine amidase [Waterburya agarophytonicola K14]|uniref:N-acetylmuramoyl-L-alanine amidase n=1 Tax=Waterburya agarophytonicola KI4 TaxID=2874699 RepID=A0A964FLP3_9CYAN|nr:peptidoglycan recognition family protein [Waterburya agarophytonicola]MCC0179503.1 N-acetylmuramoyl-L-alanine amidase [Waterburya agarophytonicola KI4]
MKANIFRFRQPIIATFGTIFLSFLLSVSHPYLHKDTMATSNSLVAFTETERGFAISDGVDSNPMEQTKTSLVASTAYKTTKAFEQYKPRYAVAKIDPSNYGDRYSTDIHGKTLNNQPIAVLHETVGSATSAINTFRTPQSSDQHQSSYHALITLDGMIVYLVPSDKRAFGAGNSVFKSSWGIETVQTNPNLPASVNNFAYHISLETPPDGRNKSGNSYHSGYTDSQYKSLAWLLALSSIPDERITTHKNVDLSGNRFDPRSFDFAKFLEILHTYRQPTAG